MSQHEGVSCDSCMKSNFRGKRFKCLICHDYDLCSTCFENGSTAPGSRHSTEHPMQCILTRTDFEVYYGGESFSNEQPQSFICPVCSKMGFTEATLFEHATQEHSDTFIEAACPICCSISNLDAMHMADDFISHLTLEHRNPREIDEPQAPVRGRRAPHISRGVNSTRPRRNQMQLGGSGGGSSTISSNLGSNALPSASGQVSAPIAAGGGGGVVTSANNMSAGFQAAASAAAAVASVAGLASRDSVDPLAEILTHLSGVRRTGAGGVSSGGVSGSAVSGASHLHQIQMQLQLDRNEDRRPNAQDWGRERVITRRNQGRSGSTGQSSGVIGSSGLPYVVLMESLNGGPSGFTSAANAALLEGTASSNLYSNGSNSLSANVPTSVAATPANVQSGLSNPHQFLLASSVDSPLTEEEQQQLNMERADRSLFVQELLLGTLQEDFTNRMNKMKLSGGGPE